jgi:hypothetical protein
MAILLDAKRAECSTEFQSESSRERDPVAVTKAELRTAIDAVDQWLEDNKVSFNQSIPLPVRTALTAKQKARILRFVARKRFQEDA